MKNLSVISVLAGVLSALLSGFVICYSVQVGGFSGEQKLIAIATLVLVNVCFAIIGTLKLSRLVSILSGALFLVVFAVLIFGFWRVNGSGWYYILDPNGAFGPVNFSIFLSLAQGVLLLLGGILGARKQ